MEVVPNSKLVADMELSLDRKTSISCQRMLLCATSAISSALAILTLTWYRRKRRRIARQVGVASLSRRVYSLLRDRHSQYPFLRSIQVCIYDSSLLQRAFFSLQREDFKPSDLVKELEHIGDNDTRVEADLAKALAKVKELEATLSLTQTEKASSRFKPRQHHIRIISSPHMQS